MASVPRGAGDCPRATERSTGCSTTVTTVGLVNEDDGSSDRLTTSLLDDVGLDARSSRWVWSGTGTLVPVSDAITYTAMARPEIKRTTGPPALMLKSLR